MTREVRHWLGAAALVAVATGAALAGPEADIQARHKALVAAINRGDTKAMRPFYTADYKAEAQGRVVNLEQSLQILDALKKEGVKLTGKASLSKIKVKGNTATALETADVTATLKDGTKDTRKGQKAEQRWKKVGGVWKLQYEKALQ